MTGDDSEAAPAKVNLFLHVTGRRADGYHLLDSLAVFAGVTDHLFHTSGDALSLRVTGPFSAALRAEADNLVLRAARALAAETGRRPGGALTLEKHIPVASGIGGGSADAAATLRLLCRAWKRHPGAEALARLAAGLGADVPVCLDNRPARMRGVGEHLTPAPVLPPYGIVLVNPGVPLSTVAVFRERAAAAEGFSPDAALPEGWGDAAAMAGDLARLSNDLQPAAMRLAPVIGGVLEALAATPGCLLARMSGSGATCFGLYATERAARAAAATLDRAGWWVWGGAPHATG